MYHEQTARANHKGSCNCAQAVFVAFARELGLSTAEAMNASPKPRAEGGKCGAFLAAREILSRLKPEAVEAFEQRFLAANGSTECLRLRLARKPCNDYVGGAARMAEEALE